MQPASFSRLFPDKKALAVFCVWSALLLALVAGIAVNAVRYQQELITEALVLRRLWYALLCFVMMTIVFPVERIFRIRFSLFLEIALPVFAFAALAGGTVYGLYELIPAWDKILHTLSGPLFAIVGLEIASLLLQDQPTGLRKVVAAVVIAFLFALAVGYIWEIFEYTVDSVIPGYNNQRWAAGLIEDLGNGTYLVSDKRGTALIDTMGDLICNFVGAFLFLIPVLIACGKEPTRLAAFRIERRAEKKKAEKEKDVRK